MIWNDLKYWNSGEYQVVEERLKDLSKKKVPWCPGKTNVFKAMDLVPFDQVKVMVVGQDPYPDPEDATGVAFSIPPEKVTLPITLQNIISEYCNDLHQPMPSTGDLTSWCKQGVFLWNAIPTCEAHKSLSHNWDEWNGLTEEIIRKLSSNDKYIVFVFLGGVAREFVKFVNQDECGVIETSHPSPRGSINSKQPFLGSRIFSRTNDLLCSHGVTQINWRL